MSNRLTATGAGYCIVYKERKIQFKAQNLNDPRKSASFTFTWWRKKA